jgi:AraC-like DNA-binding protein
MPMSLQSTNAIAHADTFVIPADTVTCVAANHATVILAGAGISRRAALHGNYLLHAAFPTTLQVRGAGNLKTTLAPVSAAPLVKLLAYVDAGRGISVMPELPLLVTSATSLPAPGKDAQTLHDIVVRGLVESSPALGEFIQLARTTESYRLIRFLLSADASVTIEDLGQAYGLSPSHFRRKCHAALGRALKSELRLLRAARSLLDTSRRPRSFTRMAEDHGFASSAHFSADIKNLIGLSPRDIYPRSICGR